MLRNAALAAGLALVTAVAVAQGTTDEEVRFSSTDATLAGTLTLPAGPGPHPAVLLVSGSGPQDRDSALPGVEGYRPFAEIATTLANAGIAVLRYDDRGAGASTGDNLTATTADLAEDAQAGLRFLRSRPDIDPLQVGVVGHSEGALIAPMLASRDPGVAFFVALAPPVADPIEGLVTQERRILEAAGLPADQVADGAQQARTVLELNRDGDWEVLEAVLRYTAQTQLEALPAERRAALGDSDTALEAILASAMVQQRTWMHWVLTHDPARYWRQVRVPALAVFGTLDVQVDAPQNRAALERIASTQGLSQVDIVTLEGANHLFQRAGNGGVEEYAQLSPNLMPALLETLRSWLREHVSIPGAA
ncbi:MAG: alpha/beta fold hydrolase [Deinococcales bacterium]